MAKPKFTLGASELQFTVAIAYPVRKPHQKIQIVDRTAAGTLQVEDLAVDIHTRPLTFKNMPKVDHDALCAWYDTIAEGAKNDFTFTDQDGNDLTVKMLTNPLDFSETAHQRFSGELLLEIVA